MPPGLIPTGSYLQYVLLNLISALLCASAHNTLYFMLGFSAWFFHFLHYLATFLILLLLNCTSCLPRKSIPLKEYLPISLTQVVVSLATATVHSSGKDGALYTMRMSDCGTTILVMLLTSKFLESKYVTKPEMKPLVIFIAVAASFAWCDTGLLDTRLAALLALPFLVGASALHYMITFQKQQKLGCTSEQLLLYHSGLTSALLFLPAMLYTSDTFNKDMMSTVSAWEIIDYALLAMGILFMVGMIYSKYWLLGNCNPETYNMFRHFKYTTSAVGQWFTQNLVYWTVVSATGKLLSIAALSVYFYKKRKEHNVQLQLDNKKTTVVANGYHV